MKTVIHYSLIGALIGLSTSYIITTIVLLLNPTRVLNGTDLLLEMFLAIFLGVGCGLISIIFYMERLPYFVKLAIHYVVILTLVLICGAIGDWYRNPLEQPIGFLSFIGIQFVVYVIIFAVVYWSDLREIKQINEKLTKSRGD